MSIWGSIIAAGASLLGGREASDSAEAAAARNVEFQREFARAGIQWRAQDAREAGLHPLFALGGGAPSFSPNPIVVGDRGISEAGQHLGRAVSATMNTEERALKMAALKAHEASAERDFAQASYYRSLAAREAKPAAAPFPSDVVTGAYGGGAVSFPVSVGTKIESHPLYKDAVKLEPDTMASRSVMFGGETAGRDHPAMRQFEFPGGFKMLLPATQGGGVPEEIDFTMLPLVIGANVERYGTRWLMDALSYTLGRSPDKRDARARELGLEPPRR